MHEQLYHTSYVDTSINKSTHRYTSVGPGPFCHFSSEILFFFRLFSTMSSTADIRTGPPGIRTHDAIQMMSTHAHASLSAGSAATSASSVIRGSSYTCCVSAAFTVNPMDIMRITAITIVKTSFRNFILDLLSRHIVFIAPIIIPYFPVKLKLAK